MIRRKFINNVGTSLVTVPLISSFFNVLPKSFMSEPLDVHLFSKHLHFLDVNEAAQIAAELGFQGLDLTVRPNGHVIPKNVEADLPKAISDINRAGLHCEMITTAINDATNPRDIAVIKTAAEQGVKLYRSNWFSYKNDLSLEASLDHYKEKIQQLSMLNKEHNIVGCYQNHSGMKIGASVWEVKQIIANAHPDYFGVQYDIRHAVAEGGRSWPNGVKLLKDNIRTIVLEDFKWEKVGGKWSIVNVPIGEGMVDFTSYFKILKSYGLRPPVSLHLEYPLGGAEKGKYEITLDQQNVFEAMKDDLTTIQKLWKNA